MVTAAALANTSVLSHNYPFFFVVRTFKFYSQQFFSIKYSIINCDHHAIE